MKNPGMPAGLASAGIPGGVSSRAGGSELPVLAFEFRRSPWVPQAAANATSDAASIVRLFPNGPSFIGRFPRLDDYSPGSHRGIPLCGKTKGPKCGPELFNVV